VQSRYTNFVVHIADDSSGTVRKSAQAGGESLQLKGVGLTARDPW